jgi:hypothetical protein
MCTNWKQPQVERTHITPYLLVVSEETKSPPPWEHHLRWSITTVVAQSMQLTFIQAVIEKNAPLNEQSDIY